MMRMMMVMTTSLLMMHEILHSASITASLLVPRWLVEWSDPLQVLWPISDACALHQVCRLKRSFVWIGVAFFESSSLFSDHGIIGLEDGELQASLQFSDMIWYLISNYITWEVTFNVCSLFGLYSSSLIACGRWRKSYKVRTNLALGWKKGICAAATFQLEGIVYPLSILVTICLSIFQDQDWDMVWAHDMLALNPKCHIIYQSNLSLSL